MTGVELPSYLTAPPSGEQPDPPVDTRKQLLPLGQLDWPDFERLCARLIAKQSDVEDARLYGEAGQKQGGIDILAHGKEGAIAVYQCRRVKTMTPAKIKQAVTDFLEGPWRQRASSFAICTSTSLGSKARSDEIERQRQVLKSCGKDLETWDREELSLALKDHPDLVDDFFGRAWVDLFNGPEAAERLGSRLDFEARRATRDGLARFYREVFLVHDAGLSLAPPGVVGPADLRDLFTSPDILEDVHVPAQSVELDSQTSTDVGHDYPEQPGARARPRRTVATSSAEFRISAEAWLGSQRRAIVGGDPGAGKSSLLRFLALDLLSAEPRFSSLNWDWGSPIPLWIPFGRWTELITEGKRSLMSLVGTWLEELGRPELAALYSKALEDGRAVLLVDGLDEWKTEAAARVAFDQLRIYVGERDLRAVATTRPSAFEKLGESPGDWRACQLATLDTNQQCDVIERLISWSSSARNEGRVPAIALGAEQFIEELSKTPDLRELAGVPLTLVFLHWIRARDAQLPRDRFQAYAHLVDLLLSRYPAKRIAATGIVEDLAPSLREEDARLVLGRVALAVHESGGVEISLQEAVDVARSQLTDEEIGPGLDLAAAKRVARELLDHSRERLGLLFEPPGSGSLAFLHRSVQEHLCASYLARRPMAVQRRFVEERGVDPRWKEVILNLLHLTLRPDEVDELVESLSELRRRSGWDEGDPLMAEIGVGRFGCSSRLSNELIETAASDCETFARSSISGSIGMRLIEGLEGCSGESALRRRIRGWLAPQPWSLAGLLAGMEEWPDDPSTDRALVRACFSEVAADARQAAHTYAERRLARGEGPGALLDLLDRPLVPVTRAAIVESLGRHWPQEPRVQEEFRVCRSSRCAELKLVSIAMSVSRGSHDRNDLDDLLELAREDSGIGSEWRDTLMWALIEGWTRDPRLKAACLEDIRAGRRPYEGFDYGLAEALLIEAFPEDPDVVQYAVGQIRSEKFPFLGLDHGAWRGLARNFADCPELISAADDWIVKQEFHQPEVSYAALIGKTEVGRRKLLNELRKSSLPFWAARSLLDGWGTSDTTVRDALVEVATGEAKQASMIAHQLPDLPLSREYVRNRLVSLMEDPSVPRADLILQAAVDLEDKDLNIRLLEPALAALNRRAMGWDFLGALVRIAPDDDRVRAMALGSLRQRDPPWFSLAQTYGDDDEVRGRLIDHAAPLPARMRSRGWRAVTPSKGSEHSITSMAASYPVENDAPTATLMARAWAGSATTIDCREEMVDAAVEELRTGSPRWEGHAQAGLAVLLNLKRLDAYSRATPFAGSKERFTVPLSDHLNPNVEIASSVVDHWDEVVDAFGDDYPSAFRGISSKSDEDFWKSIAPVADRNPRSRAALLDHIREQKSISSAELSFLARTQPRSQSLIDRCLQALGGKSLGIPDAGLSACEILAEQFSGDAELGNHLADSFEGTLSPIVLVALAEGWGGEPFQRALNHARKSDLRMHHEFVWRIHISHPDPQTAISGIDGFIEHGWSSRAGLVDVPIRSISKRLARDSAAARMASEKLMAADASSSITASYSRLLSMSIGIDEDMRRILEARRIAAFGREIGVDLAAGAQRPVAHAIGDALELG